MRTLPILTAITRRFLAATNLAKNLSRNPCNRSNTNNIYNNELQRHTSLVLIDIRKYTVFVANFSSAGRIYGVNAIIFDDYARFFC